VSLPDDYRSRAQLQRGIANELLGEADILTNPTKFVSAIVGQVNATVLEGLADAMDYLRLANVEKPEAEHQFARHRKLSEHNNAIRRAAALGDWAAFDRLVGESTPKDSEPPGGN
jgi:hypothetical protein